MPKFDLALYQANTLKRFYAYHAPSGKTVKRKKALVERMTRFFLARGTTARTLAQLNDLEKRALNMLLRAPKSGLSLEQFFFILVKSGVGQLPKAPENVWRWKLQPNPRQPSQSLIDIPARFCLLGLAVPWGDNPRPNPLYDLESIHYLSIPTHIRQTLPEPTVEIDQLGDDQIAQTASGSARHFQRDLYLYWSQIRQEPARLKQTGYLYKKDLKNINAGLLDPAPSLADESEEPYLLYLRDMAMALGLLHLSNNGYLQAVAAPAFLFADPESRVRKSYELWYRAEQLIENGSTYYQNEESREEARLTASFKRGLIDVLRRSIDDNVWLATASLAQSLLPLLIVSLDIVNAYGYSYYYGHSLSQIVQSVQSVLKQKGDDLTSSYLEEFLTESLHWMGFLDLAFDKRHRLVGVRLTPAGRFALGIDASLQTPSQTGQVILQPNFHILAIDPVSDSTLAALDSFAKRIKTGRVIEYELDRDAIHRGALNDWPITRVIQYLREITHTELPGNVLRTLQEWDEGHKRIRFFKQDILLETATAAELDRLFDDETIAANLGQRLTLRAALVSDLAPLRRLFADRGLMLESSFAGGPAEHPLFRLHENGLLEPTVPVVPLSASAQVAPFATLMSEGLTLTRQSVQNAANGGMTTEQIITTLRAALVHPLSPDWEKRLKTWSAHFGRVRATNRVLVQVRDAEILEELRSDPDLAKLLKPFRPKGALATVDPADKDLLCERLAAYGVSVDEDLA